MDREIILVTLLTALCGPLILAAGAIRTPLRAFDSARRFERHAWWRLWVPLLPAALVVAFLLGWAVQEPEAAEPAGPALLGIAGLFAALWLRAIVRAGRALRLHPTAAAATTGLLRPRVAISPELSARLDERALNAALEHEAAHARHHDPLRLWLAQLATDLQWPLASARQRFADWRHALELARDAEACERVDGADLATAVIEAARLTIGGDASAAVGLVTGATTGNVGFSDRIHRLLDHAGAPGAPIRRWPGLALLAWLIGAAIAAGAVCGELVIAALPGLSG